MTQDAARLSESLDVVQTRAFELAAVIGAPLWMLPTFGTSEESGRPSIESRPDGLAYVVRERGSVFEDRLAANQDEVLYWIFRSVTQRMASDWEVQHRGPGRDSRLVWMPVQHRLLASLSPAWELRLRDERADILAKLGIAADAVGGM